MSEHKTVFISYRRAVSWAIARLVYNYLRGQGYDVFMDVESLDAGQFDTILLRQIEARAHFIVILAPGTLERCAEPDDWLRREIEHAIDHKRNIVPLLVNEFSFSTNMQYLTGKLSDLPRFNGLTVLHEYFDAAMGKLRDRFLKQPVYGVVRPTPASDQAEVEQRVAEADALPIPTPQELRAEVYFNRGLSATDRSEKIGLYSEAIRLKPDDAEAYFKRGSLRKQQSDLEGAIRDYEEAIRLNPNDAWWYNTCGLARFAQGDLEGAIRDYSEAIRLKPDDAEVYFKRGYAREAKNDLDEAIRDYQKYLDLGGGRQRNNQAQVKRIIRDLKRKLG